VFTWPAGATGSRYRRALIRTAASATAAGLPVVPGAWWSATEHRFVCDRSDCTRAGPHPVTGPHPRSDLASGSSTASVPGLLAGALRRPGDAIERWHRHPYAVLVPTGEGCDVVDVPARLGRLAQARLDQRAVRGPVIAAGPRWFFLTAVGGDLPGCGGDVLVHGQGSWIVLPPSRGPAGQPAEWLVRPGRRSWDLPDRDAVIHALTSAAVPAQRLTPPAPVGRTGVPQRTVPAPA
jgi:hypothetical protein